MPKLTSGYDLFCRLRDSGTGDTKLDHMLSWFPKNRKGELTEDLPADEFLDMIQAVDDDALIPPVTKLKAESFYLTGEYVPVVQTTDRKDYKKVKPLFAVSEPTEVVTTEDEEDAKKVAKLKKKMRPPAGFDPDAK